MDDLDEPDWDDRAEELDELLDDALQVLAARGPMTAEDLAYRIDADLDDVELLKSHPRIAFLGDERLGSVSALMAATVLTHRLTSEEVADHAVRLDVDLAALLALRCGEDHIHLADGDVATITEGEEVGPAVLEGPEGWLGEAGPGDLVGFRMIGESPGAVEVVHVSAVPPRPEGVGAELAAGFARFGDGDGMPVAAEDLLFELAATAPALVAGVVAPLSQLLDDAGFEVRGGHTAPLGADWETFGRLQYVLTAARRHGLEADGGQALVLACELNRLFGLGELDELDRDLARSVAALLDEAVVAAAFADLAGESPQSSMAFLAQMRTLAGGRHGAGLAWAESLVAGRVGELDRAEACLRAALVCDPEHQGALEDAAWYASDRGDASQAVRFLDRLEDDEDDSRTALLRTFAAGSAPARSVGRNEPCPCGSGRKFKHCCLNRPAGPVAFPLPARAPWLWRKLVWWLDESERTDAAFLRALALHDGSEPLDDETFLRLFEVGASLVLFTDGAVDEFLRQRGPLLPADEHELVATWSQTAHSLYEVVDVRPFDGVVLRDQRTESVIDVADTRSSTELEAGDLIYAHPVSDGAGYQMVDGFVPIPRDLREAVLSGLDEGGNSAALADVIGAARRPILDPDGEPIAMCAATYRVADPDGAAVQLDALFERQDNGAWADFGDVDGRRWLRAVASIEGDELELSASSEKRLRWLRDTVGGAIGALVLLGEKHTAPPPAPAEDEEPF